jgi:hypothetical protein
MSDERGWLLDSIFEMLFYRQFVTSQAWLIAGTAEPYPANATMIA